MTGRCQAVTDRPEVCPTCKEPYVKISVAEGLIRGAFCSNGFHCCRDCTWENGRRLFICHECLEWERQATKDFIATAVLQWRDQDPSPERSVLADICATRMNNLHDADSVEDLLNALMEWKWEIAARSRME